MYSSLWKITFLLPLVKDATFQMIITKPRNAAALDSTQVTLDCAYSTRNLLSSVRWREFVTERLTGELLASNTAIIHPDVGRRARYSITNPVAGQFNLHISPFTSDDAGFYVCEDDLERNRAGAYVMYLTRKTCNATCGGNVVTAVVEGQQFTLKCQRNYKSFEGWPPVLEWLGQSSRNITTNTSISYEVDLTATEAMNNIIYRCATRFLNPPHYRTDIPSDTRKPTFTEENCTTQIEVHWPAKNFERIPERSVYYPGHSVRCQASANPSPKAFTWNKLKGNGTQIISGDTITITEAMLGHSEYECVVTNNVLGTDTKRSHKFTFTVQMRSTTPQNTTQFLATTMVLTTGKSEASPPGSPCLGTGAIVGIVISVLLAVAINNVLLTFFLMKRRKDTGAKHETELKPSGSPMNGVVEGRGDPGGNTHGNRPLPYIRGEAGKYGPTHTAEYGPYESLHASSSEYQAINVQEEGQSASQNEAPSGDHRPYESLQPTSGEHKYQAISVQKEAQTDDKKEAPSGDHQQYESLQPSSGEHKYWAINV